MKKLGILETDLEEKFILGKGKGGQKKNKTASCVSLIHKPSGLMIKCQKTRSQSQNRILARTLLCEQIEKKQLKEKQFKEKEQAKKRFQKRKRANNQKEKILIEKKKRSELKKKRAKIKLTNFEE